MKAHEYAIEGPFRHQVLVYCAVGCAVTAGFAATWFSLHKHNPMLALIPPPGALALLWLFYSIFWGRYLWKFEFIRKIHRVPVFCERYSGFSISNDEMPPRDLELHIKQTWTSIIIICESSLMEGHSVMATAFPDSSRIIAIMEMKPRSVFDKDWLKRHSMPETKAREFALPQQMVVDFRFKDGCLIRGRWYASLEHNHIGEFYELPRGSGVLHGPLESCISRG